MASPKQRVYEIAAQRAAGFHGRQAALQHELEQLEAQKVAIQAQLDTALHAVHRLNNFNPFVGADLQCPFCWIDHGRQAVMRPIGHPPGADTRTDLFRCNACGTDIEI